MLIKDLKLILHEPRLGLLAAILLAAAIAAVLFGRANSASPRIAMGVADNDASEYSGLLISYFRDNEVFNSYIEVIEEDEAELESRFSEGELDMYLVIPKDFTANLININNVAMKAVINSSDPTKAVVYRNLLDSYSRYITAVEAGCQTLYDVMKADGYEMSEVEAENTAVSYDLIFTALGKDTFFEREYIERFEGISLVNYYIYSLVMLLVLYIGAFAGLSGLKGKLGSAEKRLATIGRKPIIGKLSKAFAYTVICGGALCLALIAVNMLSPVSFKPQALAAVFASVFVSCFVFVVFGSCFKSLGSYIITANMLILLITVAGGGIIPIMYLPEAMASVARLTPNYWFIRMLL